MTPKDEARLRRLRKLSHLLDNQFRIPGTDTRIGLDGLIGLVPGVGDTVTLLPQLYIIYLARELGVDRRAAGHMLLNVFIDWAVGSIPLAGDVFDTAFKASSKNRALLEKELGLDAEESD